MDGATMLDVILAFVLIWNVGVQAQCGSDTGMHMCAGGTHKLATRVPYIVTAGGTWPKSPCSCKIVSDFPTPVVVYAVFQFPQQPRSCNGATKLTDSFGRTTYGTCGAEWDKYLGVTGQNSKFQYVFNGRAVQTTLCVRLQLLSPGPTSVYVVCGSGITITKESLMTDKPPVVTQPPPPPTTTLPRTTTTTSTPTTTTSTTTTTTTTPTTTTTTTTSTTTATTKNTTIKTTSTTGTYTPTIDSLTVNTIKTHPTGLLSPSHAPLIPSTTAEATTPKRAVTKKRTKHASTSPKHFTTLYTTQNPTDTTSGFQHLRTVSKSTIQTNNLGTSYDTTPNTVDATETSSLASSSATEIVANIKMDDEANDESILIVVIALSSCAGLVLFVVLIVAYVYCMRRKKRFAEKRPTTKKLENGNIEHGNSASGEVSSDAIKHGSTSPKLPTFVKMISTRSTWTSRSSSSSSSVNTPGGKLDDTSFTLGNASPSLGKPSFGYDLPYNVNTVSSDKTVNKSKPLTKANSANSFSNANSASRYQAYKSSKDILIRSTHSVKPPKPKRSHQKLRKAQSDASDSRPPGFKTEAGVVRDPLHLYNQIALKVHKPVTHGLNAESIKEVSHIIEGPAGTSTPLNGTMNTKQASADVTSNTPKSLTPIVISDSVDVSFPPKDDNKQSPKNDCVPCGRTPDNTQKQTHDSKTESNAEVKDISSSFETKGKKKYKKKRGIAFDGIHRNSYRESIQRARQIDHDDDSDSDWKSDSSSPSQSKKVSFGAVLTVHRKSVEGALLYPMV